MHRFPGQMMPQQFDTMSMASTASNMAQQLHQQQQHHHHLQQMQQQNIRHRHAQLESQNMQRKQVFNYGIFSNITGTLAGNASSRSQPPDGANGSAKGAIATFKRKSGDW